ncbi:mannosyltransferase putative-domain-containing protein [Xylariomycetidae sp. FL2044]|nr:mannosyltransferase putative-domain-containing protein [Xylariomycetidae sp. FL2044]
MIQYMLRSPLHNKKSIVFVSLVFCAVCLYFGLPLWYQHQNVQLSQHYLPKLGLEIGNSQWGLMGAWVKDMSLWARQVVDRYPHYDSEALTTTLLHRYPWMKGTNLYFPWAERRTEAASGYAETGLVICAGSGNIHLAAHLIRSLRDVIKSTLPIEIAYAGDTDLRPEHQQYLESLGSDIHFIDLLESFPHARDDLANSGWAMKPFAMLASRSRKTILADADAVFLKAPDRLFETPGLIDTGILLYRDRSMGGESEKGRSFIIEQLESIGRGPSPQYEHDSLYFNGTSAFEADSGVVAVDKRRPEAFLSLAFSTWMNTKAVREEVTGTMYHGDKETFWIAPELAGIDYYFEPLYAGSISTAKGSGADGVWSQICSIHILHVDHTGADPFWFNGGLYRNKNFKNNGFMNPRHWWKGHTGRDGNGNVEWKGNEPCVTASGVEELSKQQVELIGKMVKVAQDVDDNALI